MPVFFSSTCFQPSGAAQQQLGFLNFTSESIWKWRMCDVKFMKPISNYLLCTAHLLMRLDTPLHGNNAKGAKYAVYYVSVVMHTVFENIKWLHSCCVRIKKGPVAFLACLFPANMVHLPYFAVWIATSIEQAYWYFALIIHCTNIIDI